MRHAERLMQHPGVKKAGQLRTGQWFVDLRAGWRSNGSTGAIVQTHHNAWAFVVRASRPIKGETT